MPTEAEYWDGKREEFSRDQLGTIQKAAAGWTTLFGALLGVFGTVTFAGGLTTIDKLADPLQLPIKLLTLLAAALTLVATILCGLAANILPKKAAATDWATFRNNTLDRASTAYVQLRAGLVFAVLAVVVVIAGSAIVIIVGQVSPEAKAPTVLAVVDGHAVCGKLQKSADGGLQVAGQVLSGVSSVTIVSACPS